MELFPSFTATTDLGWILLMQPRQISFIITMIRTTLMDPAVEAEQPPINSRAIMMIWHVAGHRMLVSRTYPVVVAMLTTWKKDSRSAELGARPSTNTRLAVQMQTAIAMIHRYTLSSMSLNRYPGFPVIR